MFRRILLNIAVFSGIVLLGLIALRAIPHPPLSQGLMFSTAYYDKNGELLRFTLANDDMYRVWTPLEDISPYLINGVLLHEDKYFYYHTGFNPFSLARGAYVSYIKKGNMQGGSTLTMQLARMKWKLNTRTIYGKLTQIIKAIELELFYSKDDILEAYLNYAPYGRNIVGVGSSSLIYFDKKPRDLTLPEALTLSVLPQSPSYRVDKNSNIVGEKLTNARNSLLEKYEKEYNVDSLNRALFDLPLLLRQPEKLPFIAPHFISQVENENFLKAKKSYEVNTSLDLKLQNLIDLHVKSYINTNTNRGIQNAAVLLVDSRNMGVVAHIGSANFFNNEIQGQVNGVTAKRSPGSTLKPFIYALAIEQGIIHPMSVLKDVPTNFGSYSPENFDYVFSGPLSATNALNRSRNIPAVYLNSKLKNLTFYNFLKRAKVSKMKSEGHYGLALALGGGEVTMMEIARLYGILANRGVMREVKVFKDEDEPYEPLNFFSKETTFVTLDMLGQNSELKSISSQKKEIPIYWKTGTSWGFRDAWSVGIVGDYIVVVWLGNFDNVGNTAFIGNDVAAPLFFNIVNALRATEKLNDANKIVPTNVKKVDICLSSGDLATIWCKRKSKTWFIPGVSPIKVDTVYRPVIMDNATKKPLCSNKKTKDSYIEVYEYWSTDILDIFKKAGLPKRNPPDMSHCDSLNMNSFGIAPFITSPLKNTTYAIRANRDDKNKIVFSATADASVGMLYWFFDDEFIGSTEPLLSLDFVPKKAGKFNISVIDDHGRVDKRDINIIFTN